MMMWVLWIVVMTSESVVKIDQGSFETIDACYEMQEAMRRDFDENDNLFLACEKIK